MRRRRILIRILGAVCIFAIIMAAIIVFITPGPDSPEWWLMRAREEARTTWDYDIHRGIIEAYCMMGKLGQARDAAHGYMNPFERSWLQETFDAILVKLRLKRIQYKSGSGWRLEYGKAFLDLDGPMPGVTSVLAVAQATAGDLAGAKASAAAIRYTYTTVRTYCDMALVFNDAGNAKAFRECMELAKAVTGDRNSSFAMMAGALAKAGHLQEARTTAETIGDKWDRCRAYCRIADALAENGDTDAARKHLQLARSVAATVTSAYLRQSLMGQIAGSLAANGDVEEAKAVAEEGKTSDAWVTNVHIAKAQADAGEFEAAWCTAGEMTSDEINLGGNERGEAYRHIAAAQAKAGEVKKLKRRIESIKRRRESEARQLGPAAWPEWDDIRRELANAYLGAAQGLIQKQKESSSSEE